MPILQRRCPVDGLKFTLLSMNGELSALEHPDIDHLGCPQCGAEGVAVLAEFRPVDLGKYPYHDRGLGCIVKDPKHHRWLLTHEPNGTLRDQPLVQTHGEFDPNDELDRWQSKVEEDKRAYSSQMDELMNGPNRESYGRLSDILQEKGAIERLWGNDADG